MSDTALDRGFYFASPMTDWYRERPFKVAFMVSLFVHAALIALVPGFRAVVIEPPKVLNVEIILPEQPQVRPMPLREVVPPAPVTTPPPPQRTVEEAVARPVPQVEPRPEPVVRQPELEPPPPRPEPRPEPLVVPKPEPRPEPRVEPRFEIKPEPRIEPRSEPPPVARAEPRPEPPPLPAVAPRSEPRPEPQPVPRVEPPPAQVAQPRIEPVTPPDRPPAPPVVPTTVQPPAAVAVPAPPQPVAPKAQPESVRELALVQKYKDSISGLIRSHENYPIVAKRRGWEGTTVVGLTLALDGSVKGISVIESSGRDILDEAALTMVRKAAPLPRAPEELRGQERMVRVPIVFKLQQS